MDGETPDAIADLPSGWVTFVFTDIEGSTRLFRRLGAEYPPLLEAHRRLLRAAWVQHGGVELGTEGDSFFVVFATPASALAACLDGQLALAGHPWPDDAPIRVRMGVHSGTAEPVGGDYVALAVHQAARVAATGHGGQVVVSDATRSCTEGALPGTAFSPLGSYRLKDFDEPQPLFQLTHPALVASFPALKALPAAGHNLPIERTAFIGRDADVTALASIVAANPLVTITGPGGVGKTRLALEVARRLIPSFGDGVWLVELGSLVDPLSVAPAVASALGIREEPGREVTASLLDGLAGRQALLVLDNCEHLIDAAAEIARTLSQGCPDLAILATGREPLRAAGERVWSVSPMDGLDAQRLFVDRAAAVRHDFAATEADDQTIAAICEMVDHLPLAVELAAARVRALAPSQILSRLGSRLGLLAGNRRDAPGRQQTLRATIDWSYGLLDPAEQALLRNLSPFRGGCSLEAAEAVAGAQIDELQSLVEKSLLLVAGERFVLLETIREFAAERLGEAGEADVADRRHAEHFAGAAPALGWGARGSEAGALATLEAEYDNASAAFEWGLGNDRSDVCEKLVEGLWYHWVRSGLTNHGYRLAARALEQAKTPSPLFVSLTAELARFSGDLERSVQLKQLSLAGFEHAGAPAARIAADHTDLAETFVELGRLDEAEHHAERGLALRTQVGDPYGVAHAQAAVVQLELARGNESRAAAVAEQTMPALRAAGGWSDLAWAHVRAAAAHLRLGDVARGRDNLDEAFTLGTRIAEAAVLVAAIEQAALLAAAMDDDETALHLLGAARAGRTTTGWVFGRDERALAVSGPRVGEGAEALIAEGEAWALDEATARAVAYVRAGTGDPAEGP